MKINRSNFIFLIFYVDDIMFVVNNFGLLHKTKKYLSENFEIKNMGETTYVICNTPFQTHTPKQNMHPKRHVKLKLHMHIINANMLY